MRRPDRAETLPAGRVNMRIHQYNSVAPDRIVAQVRPRERFFTREAVPEGLVLRCEAERMGLKIKKGAQGRAWLYNQQCQWANLYALEDTRPYHPTPETSAFNLYWRVFVQSHNGGAYRYVREDTGRWAQVNRAYLRKRQAKDHVAGKAVYGIIGGRRTQFVLIDLDFHEHADLGVFTDQLTVLLGDFHGRLNWHQQVADAGARGVHFIQVLPERCDLEVCRMQLRARLRQLDKDYPELARAARRAGMRSLGELEVYPAAYGAVRLPLCRGRTVLLDRPLRMVVNKRTKRWTQDVAGYMGWLAELNKGYMPVEEVMAYVLARLHKPARIIPACLPPQKRDYLVYSPSDPVPSHAGSLGKMRGRYLDTLVAFWAGAHNPRGSLDEAILLAATLLRHEVTESQAVAVLERYCDDLPDKSFSSRLQNDPREVKRSIRKIVAEVYAGTAARHDQQRSDVIMEQVAASCRRRGFRLSDKSTWHLALKAGRQAPNFEWTDEESLLIAERLAPVLKCEPETACAATRSFITFVKKFAGNEIPATAVPTILKDFAIRWGHKDKPYQFLRVLRDLGFIYLRTRERWSPGGKGRARGYGVGPRLAYKFPGAGSAEAVAGTADETDVSAAALLEEMAREWEVAPVPSKKGLSCIFPIPEPSHARAAAPERSGTDENPGVMLEEMMAGWP